MTRSLVRIVTSRDPLFKKAVELDAGEFGKNVFDPFLFRIQTERTLEKFLGKQSSYFSAIVEDNSLCGYSSGLEYGDFDWELRQAGNGAAESRKVLGKERFQKSFFTGSTVIDEKFRRQGLAKQLITDKIEFARKRESPFLAVYTDVPAIVHIYSQALGAPLYETRLRNGNLLLFGLLEKEI